ncbi:sugar transporter [Orbaceae bacterium ac157xtp]
MFSDHFSRRQAWLGIICLAFAAFVFNTTEFVPVGLLVNIADSFHMSEAHAGLVITIYAWSVALLSLPLTVLTAKIERKKLLIGLCLLFIFSHIVCGLATNFVMLVVGRIGIACAHAVFWAITTPLAVRLAPDGKKAQAMSLLIIGSSMAIVLGVPIGTLIGQVAGWRTTFSIIAIIAALVMVIFIFLLPTMQSNNVVKIRDLPRLLRRKTLVQLFVLTAIVVSGHFIAYSYIGPFMNKIGNYDESFVVILLLCMGFSGIIGSVIFSKFARYSLSNLFIIILVLLTLCLLSLYVMALHSISAIVLCLVWGAVVTIFGLLMQTKVLEATPDGSDIAMSVYSGIYNIGIGGGAFIGGAIVTSFSMQEIGYFGAVFVFVALLFFIFVAKSTWDAQSDSLTKE